MALRDAYERLDEMAATGHSSLSKDICDELPALVARYETIESGSFRGKR
jgi:hypothetical protein